MKSIRQLWDETPQGEAILDAEYQYLCAFLSDKTPYTLKQMANRISGLWDMTCEQAVGSIAQWVKIARNQEEMTEYRERQRKEMFAS